MSLNTWDVSYIQNMQEILINYGKTYTEKYENGYFVIYIDGNGFSDINRLHAWKRVYDTYYSLMEELHRWFFVYTNSNGKTKIDNFPYPITRTEALKKIKGYKDAKLIEEDGMGYLPSECGEHNGPVYKPFKY